MSSRTHWFFNVLALMGALVGAVGCNAIDKQSERDARVSPCDPLSDSESPIELGDVLAVGRDSIGTLYVVDAATEDGENRVFVSKDDALFRQRIAGGGSGRTRGEGSILLFTITDTEAPFVLIVEVSESGEIVMAVVPDEQYRGSIEDIGDEGETLEVLGEAAVEGMRIHNLPGEVEVEYLAEVEDGHTIVVTRPRDDWAYEDFQVFYGTADSMVQRQVLEVARQRDGGSTTITFMIGSAEVVVDFPVVSTQVNGEPTIVPGPATLQMGGRELTVTHVSDEARDLGSLTFLCVAT